MSRIVVAGAGAWGGWIALHLRRAGHAVTLVDPWGPGNARASSGDESRIVRANYGAASHYVGMAVRALALWREFELAENVELIRRCGLLWMDHGRDEANRASLSLMRDAGVAFEELSPAELHRRYPQINPDGIAFAILEPDAGYAFARRACREVFAAFLRAGGGYVRAAVQPVNGGGDSIQSVSLSDGSVLSADAFVFACGSWLPHVLPNVLSGLIRPTRQEVFYFGESAESNAFSDDAMPAWIDFAESIWYGSAGNESRGFKIGDDARGAETDPTTQSRVPTEAMIRKTREYAAHRFPALADAPILESRVCQYENSPDNDFIIDRHPAFANAWIAGGGSGHGFKHSPAIGELVCQLVLSGAESPAAFRLSRFS